MPQQARVGLRRQSSGQAAFASLGFFLRSSPRDDGSPRLVGQDGAGLVTVELIGDPIFRASVTAPVPGSGAGSEGETGAAMGAEAVIVGDPSGMSDWVIREISAMGTRDAEVSETFGKVKVSLQWSPVTLGSFTLTYDRS